MATLVTTGRAGLAASVAARNIFLGIGSGLASWDSNGVDWMRWDSLGFAWDSLGIRSYKWIDFSWDSL